MRAATPLADLTEQEWDAQLFRSPKALARQLGWHSYHTLRSKGSAPGYPDRTLWRDRLIVAELKTEKGKPTDRQREVLTALAKAGAEVYLWRPSDLDEIGQILSSRWSFHNGWLSSQTRMWSPRSLWMPSGCRRYEESGT